MDLPDFSMHSFIVKVWLEETAEEAGEVVWRGYIAHASSQDKRYFEDLDEITSFINPYLGQMGVKFSWLKRLKRKRRNI